MVISMLGTVYICSLLPVHSCSLCIPDAMIPMIPVLAAVITVSLTDRNTLFYTYSSVVALSTVLMTPPSRPS